MWWSALQTAEPPSLAADTIASLLTEAITVRGTASLALSGGKTPADLGQLVTRDVGWPAVHVFQVDERAVPLHDPARNWSIVEPLVDAPARKQPTPNARRGRMTLIFDTQSCCALWSASLRSSMLFISVLAADGHTASLVPGDAALDVADRTFTWVDPYQGHRRLTLTLPLTRKCSTPSMAGQRISQGWGLT